MLRVTTVMLLALVAGVLFGPRWFLTTIAVGYVLHLAVTFPRRRAQWKRQRLRHRVGRTKRLDSEWRTLMQTAWTAYDDYAAVMRSARSRLLRAGLEEGLPQLEAALVAAASAARTGTDLGRSLRRRGAGDTATGVAAKRRMSIMRRRLREHVAAMQVAAVQAAQVSLDADPDGSEQADARLHELRSALDALANPALDAPVAESSGSPTAPGTGMQGRG